jgi:hypothetical protein
MEGILYQCRREVRSFLYEEDGDTNFISVLVLVGIALALAAIFVGYKNQVTKWVEENVEQFFPK